MSERTEDLMVLRRATWNLRDEVLDCLFTHEVTCDQYRIQVAGLRILGWSLADFIYAALENKPGHLEGLA